MWVNYKKFSLKNLKAHVKQDKLREHPKVLNY
ncbi:hypothetical protein ZYGNAAKF_CDS0082 [Enterococcus phage VRE9_2]